MEVKKNCTADRVKWCDVCGDVARTLHFGGLSCDSCKVFFRRAVYHDAYKSYTCAEKGRCEMTVVKRKRCKRCRWDKCLSVGMEPRWVMNDQEKEIWRARQRRSQSALATSESGCVQKQMSQSAPATSESGCVQKRSLEPHVPDLQRLPEFLNPEEQEVIQDMIDRVMQSRKAYPFSQETRGHKATHMFAKVLLRSYHVVRMLPPFASLQPEDQRTLVRASLLELGLLAAARLYDKDNDYLRLSHFRRDAHQESLVRVPLEMSELRRVLSPELFEMIVRFIRGMQDLKPDMPIILLMGMLVIFCPEREGLMDTAKVSDLQDNYIAIFKKYVEWRHGHRNASVLFPKLLSKLSDLQELSDSHTEKTLRLAPGDIQELKEQLAPIDTITHPYPKFDFESPQGNDELTLTGNHHTVETPPGDKAETGCCQRDDSNHNNVNCVRLNDDAADLKKYLHTDDLEISSANFEGSVCVTEDIKEVVEFKKSHSTNEAVTVKDTDILNGDLSWIDDLFLPNI